MKKKDDEQEASLLQYFATLNRPGNAGDSFC
jgi:hypothetical protein